ncbi:hypothetical protein BI081_gp139 [Mycobacterium phage Tonenili]|uniref:Uncharacterized protein n=1 Tax=Mycobacterium phage Tonenili TaxID=1891703 RepID=A0A1C9EHK7_9CAUD|nr:hypothetical protein BI081_gp139 [Mycobacterium phage Tonenili]AON96968.1 hypothetical protein SEA_TONENILI_250 [Mycobacterium phage Tonenili]
MANSTPRIVPEEVLTPLAHQPSVNAFHAHISAGYRYNGRLCDTRSDNVSSVINVLSSADPLRPKTPQHFASHLREQALQHRLNNAHTPMARLRARIQQRIHDRLIGWILFD